MAKNFDLDALDAQLEALEAAAVQPPADDFAPEVEKLAEQMMSKVALIDATRNSAAQSLVEYRSTTHPETFFVRAKAVELVFDSLGVLGAFKKAEEERPEYFKETPDGWVVILRRPSSTGIFQVEFASNGKPLIDKHKVKYKAA